LKKPIYKKILRKILEKNFCGNRGYLFLIQKIPQKKKIIYKGLLLKPKKFPGKISHTASWAVVSPKMGVRREGGNARIHAQGGVCRTISNFKYLISI
jgi:hypothetical protein